MSDEEGGKRRKPIVFCRPDPTEFVILISRAGRGTGTVVGTERFKPVGCEWATDEDMEDAGYVTAERARQAVRMLARAAGLPSTHAGVQAALESLCDERSGP